MKRPQLQNNLKQTWRDTKTRQRCRHDPPHAADLEPIGFPLVATRYKYQKNMILHDIIYAASCALLSARVSIRQNISSCDKELCQNIATIFHMPPLNEWGWYLHGFKIFGGRSVQFCPARALLTCFVVTWLDPIQRLGCTGGPSRRDVHRWYWELDTKCGELSLSDGSDSQP